MASILARSSCTPTALPMWRRWRRPWRSQLAAGSGPAGIAIWSTRSRCGGSPPVLSAGAFTSSPPAGIRFRRTGGDRSPSGTAVLASGVGLPAGRSPGSGCSVAAGADIPRFLDAAAPALLVAQAIGRIGNYFNQELFGGPTGLPWALQISPAHRPVGYEQFATFHPTFLYEIVWNLALAALLVWLGRNRRVRAPGLFALYVAGYSLVGSARSSCGSTPPITSSGCGSTSTWPRSCSSAG